MEENFRKELKKRDEKIATMADLLEASMQREKAATQLIEKCNNTITALEKKKTRPIRQSPGRRKIGKEASRTRVRLPNHPKKHYQSDKTQTHQRTQPKKGTH